MMMAAFVEALLLQAGYNATLVSLGAAMLGAAAGAAGCFLILRKRAMISDAMAHATLPGVALAFLVAVSLGFDGRNLGLLLAGSALSAGLGLLAIEWIVRRTRLSEDAAIGAVLSTFFGAGVVLLTLVQTLPTGNKAGLQNLLLGSTAGMLLGDAVLILALAAAIGVVIIALRRPFILVCFDPDQAALCGWPARWVDLALLAVALGIVVVGLKVVGLILIVAMLIIPGVCARLWSNHIGIMAPAAAAIGALAAYLGVALSVAVPRVPTGAMIVLICFGLFMLSLLIAPQRGLLAQALGARRLAARIHRRQGLLALARGEPVLDALTLRVLRRDDLIRADGLPTAQGRSEAAKTLRNEKRLELARQLHPEAALSPRYLGLAPIEELLSADEIDLIDSRLGAPRLGPFGVSA
jgi:manganese/zinc/iron transport system permease protein